MGNLLFGVKNESFFDSYWTIIHFAAGIGVGFILQRYFKFRNQKQALRIYMRYGFTALLAWEYFELSLRFMEKFNLSLDSYLKIIIPQSFFEPESMINISSDLILGSLGLYLIFQYLHDDGRPHDSKK